MPQMIAASEDDPQKWTATFWTWTGSLCQVYDHNNYQKYQQEQQQQQQVYFRLNIAYKLQINAKEEVTEKSFKTLFIQWNTSKRVVQLLSSIPGGMLPIACGLYG